VELRDIWRPRLDLLLTELRNAPAVLRLSYLADLEDRELVERRVSALQKQIMDAWSAQPDCCLYELVVEREVFWRRGASPDEPARRARNDRGGP
jgi:large repetitive protein